MPNSVVDKFVVGESVILTSQQSIISLLAMGYICPGEYCRRCKIGSCSFIGIGSQIIQTSLEIMLKLEQVQQS